MNLVHTRALQCNLKVTAVISIAQDYRDIIWLSQIITYAKYMTHITLCIRHHTWFLNGASLPYTRRFRPSTTSINVMVLHRYVFYPVHHLYMQYGISCDWFYQHCFKSILYNVLRIDCLCYRLQEEFESNIKLLSILNTLFISNDFR